MAVMGNAVLKLNESQPEGGRDHSAEPRVRPASSMRPAGAPLRVLHVVDVLALTGMEYGVIKQVNRLDPERFAPMICCLQRQAAETLSLVDDRVRVFELHKPPGRDWSIVSRLAALIREHRIDVLHSHNWPTYLYSVLAARLSRVTVLIHGEHGREAHGVSKKHILINRLLAPWVTHFLAVSQSLSDDLATLWGVPPVRQTCIPNGVDTDMFGREHRSEALRTEFALDPADQIVLSIGRFKPVKGYESLLRAFALVHAKMPRVKLLLVGGANVLGGDAVKEHRAALLKLAAELRISDGVRLIGDRRDIPAFMSLCDVYVNSSRFEGMSNTVLEAMASGRPVVATAVGGNPELVTDGATGYLVPVDDPERLAQSIEALLTDRDQASRLGMAGQVKVERGHSMTAMVRAYSDLYEETVLRARLSRRVPVRERAKQIMGRGLVWSGMVWLRRLQNGNPLTILAYHRVLPLAQSREYPFQGMMMPRDLFEAHMAYLAKRYRVMDLEEGIKRLDAGTLPPRAVAVTFDDGYQDNYTYAWPVMRKYGVPATIFVVTGVIDRTHSLWWDEVAVRVAWMVEQGVVPDAIPDWMRTFLERKGETVQDIAQKTVSKLNGMPLGQRTICLNALRRGSPDCQLPADLMLTWDQLREMQRDGVRAAAHTVSHPFMDELPEDEIAREVEGCFERLRHELGEPPRLLAYPRGRVAEHVKRVLKRVQVEAAVTTESGVNREGADLLHLRRVDPGMCRSRAGFDACVFDAELSGCFDLLRK